MAKPPKQNSGSKASKGPSCWQVLCHAFWMLLGRKTQRPIPVPSLYASHTSLKPELARRIVNVVLNKTEATGGLIAVAVLSIGGNPMICEKSVALGEAYWQIAIERAKSLARETSATAHTVTDCSATLTSSGTVTGYIGVASLGGQGDKPAVQLALAELAHAEEERNHAIAYNAKLRRDQKKDKKCTRCGRPLP